MKLEKDVRDFTIATMSNITGRNKVKLIFALWILTQNQSCLEENTTDNKTVFLVFVLFIFGLTLSVVCYSHFIALYLL